jgi:hypothetical protein
MLPSLIESPSGGTTTFVLKAAHGAAPLGSPKLARRARIRGANIDSGRERLEMCSCWEYGIRAVRGACCRMRTCVCIQTGVFHAALYGTRLSASTHTVVVISASSCHRSTGVAPALTAPHLII